MATKLSIQGAVRPGPAWWRNLERGLLIVLIPATVAIIQTWGFADELKATRLTLIINVALVAIVKFIGMMLVDTNDAYISNLPPEVQEQVDIPPVTK